MTRDCATCRHLQTRQVWDRSGQFRYAEICGRTQTSTAYARTADAWEGTCGPEGTYWEGKPDEQPPRNA